MDFYLDHENDDLLKNWREMFQFTASLPEGIP